jgi:predicted SPOUT superfamily RNA methylase MTH1
MWLHKNKVISKIEDFPKETFGFIYKITNNETGKFYIGKKQLMSKTNVKLGKKEKAALPTQRGRTPSKKLVVKEADWQNYWGSNKPLLEELKSHKDKFTREILMVCSSKKMLTYWEAAYQIKLDVLLIDSYNETVLGHYYKKDFLS